MILSTKTEAAPAPKRDPGEPDRRSAERYPFSAVAEAVELSSRVRVTARVSDISRTGCYLDVINVFGPGVKAQLTIRHANLKFDVVATVVYSLPGMGMGVTFNSISPEMESVLERWIAEARGEIAPTEEPPIANRMIQDFPRVERHILGRLIGLMIRKAC